MQRKKSTAGVRGGEKRYKISVANEQRATTRVYRRKHNLRCIDGDWRKFVRRREKRGEKYRKRKFSDGGRKNRQLDRARTTLRVVVGAQSF